MKYFQCKLSKGTERRIGWIEERGAKVGAHVEILDEGFWRVDEVGAHSLEKKELSTMNATKRRGFKSIDRGS